jgi:hypothetical protein
VREGEIFHSCFTFQGFSRIKNENTNFLVSFNLVKMLKLLNKNKAYFSNLQIPPEQKLPSAVTITKKTTIAFTKSLLYLEMKYLN